MKAPGARRLALVGALALCLTIRSQGANAAGPPLPPTIDNNSAQALESVVVPGSPAAPEGKRPLAGSQNNGTPASTLDLEYRVVLACDAKLPSDNAGGVATNCSYAATACSYRYPASAPKSKELLVRLEFRPRKQPTGAWRVAQEMCGQNSLPPGIPRLAVPTLGQIQTAFRRLPFAKPTVSVEPVGNVTLVNLPTFYRAVWPNHGALKPGDISRPVQLLSWSIEFAISALSYDFHFGDGSSSGPVTDAGGVYPDGPVRHTYGQTSAGVAVRVDARLTARYRVNGGAWTPLDTVAELQDAPVTPLRVREATAQLVAN